MGRDRPTVSRHWLRVPNCEWAAVKHGVKPEFRTHYRTLSLTNVEKPTPVILFKTNPSGLDTRLAVLVKAWCEPLGAISEESLGYEGVDTLAEFKIRWTASREPRFDPLKKVYVYHVRQWQPGEEREWADAIWNKLYPEEFR